LNYTKEGRICQWEKGGATRDGLVLKMQHAVHRPSSETDQDLALGEYA
jgi:hypothetical protein